MKLLLVLFALIVFSAFIVEAYEGRVRFIPRTMKKDPWLNPEEGVLVTANTPVYFAAKDDNDGVKFSEVPGIMEEVATNLLTDEKYLKVSSGNTNNPHNYPILNSTLPSSDEWPHILYPKILVAISHDLYEKLGNDLMKAIPYLLTFWNGVDMMFRSIENPKIRYNIAGIVIETECGVFDYLTPQIDKYRMIFGNGIYEAKKFWYSQKDQIPLESYDQAVTMTTWLLCVEQRECNEGSLGKAWLSSMCSEDSAEHGTERVIIFTDDGTFTGIPTAAHELGHALGMRHDNDKHFKYKDERQDLPSCAGYISGYVMSSYPSAYVYQQEWSQCSLEQLEKFIKTKNTTRLYNPPAVGNINIPRLLPGELVDIDLLFQCQTAGYRALCDDPISWICEGIMCKYTEESDDCFIALPAHGPPGTSCDPKRPDAFCMFGRCVTESEFT